MPVAELLRSSPTDPRGWYLSALLAERDGKAPEAKSALNRITALLDPVPIDQLRYRPQALMLGGLAHYGLGQREKAKPYLEAAQRLQPNSGISKLLAQIYLSEKSNDRAIASLEAYLKAQPGDAQALMLLASAHMAQGRHARATQLMNEALRTQDNPALRTVLGMSLIGGGKYADAASALEAAYQKDPRQFRAGLALATLYMQSGQAEKALRVSNQLARQQPANPGVQYLLGSILMRQGDATGARRAFDSALRLDPNYAAAAIALARLDTDERAYGKAAERLTGVLAREEKNIDALSELGRLAERQGQLADAQRWLEKAEDSSPAGNVQPGLALVEFHLRNGKPLQAMEASKRLNTKSADVPQVLVSAARVQLANGDAVAARATLARTATLAGYNAPMLVQVALLQLPARDLPGAAYSLGKALSERPDFLPAQALMAEVEIRQGELAKAEQRIRQIVAVHPKLGVGYGLQGDLALRRGQVPAAIEAYRRAHQIEQTSASLLRLHALLGTSDAAAAQQLGSQWLKAHPQDLAVRRAIADSYARAGNWQTARGAYETLLKAAPEDVEVLNNLANVMLMMGDPAALQVANQALALQPTAAHVLGTAGWAAFKAGQTDRALQLLRDARLRDPANPDTRYFLASVLASTGRRAEARDEIDAALLAHPEFTHANNARALQRTLE